ncbi:MAG: glycosyltransferase [Candidatus Heimdallarchaeota archaeon]|nr:glycosyltransferase [Candidatus Heimdallarchaeota archaeon]
MDQNDITVIIPTLNEEENIGLLCKRIHECIPNAKILVVDDGSTDRTQEIVNSLEHVDLLDRSKEPIHGLSISIRDGILNCTTETFMVIDGDLQHPPESLCDAVECFKKGGEMVIGYRIKVEDWPFFRKMISWGAQLLGHIALFVRRKQRPKDLMSGFFGARVEVVKPYLEDDAIQLKGYKMLFDLLKVIPRSVQIEQFGYIFKNREYGTSKIGTSTMWEYFKSLF